MAAKATARGALSLSIYYNQRLSRSLDFAMPMLAFLPWAKIPERLEYGRFHLVPFETAVTSGEIPASLLPAVETILEGYGLTRPVDRSRVPLLRHDDAECTAELTDEQIGTYYRFRNRLAFAALAARRFFGHRYWNSDSLRLDVRSFTPGNSSQVLVTRRRRDGAQHIIYATGTFHEKKPDYVDWCELLRDVDHPLLAALEQAGAAGGPVTDRLAELMTLFVRANTDSPAVDPQSELVDMVSAFGRLADEWKADAVVSGFLELLPPPANRNDVTGPKLTDARLDRSLRAGAPLRGAWLTDAFALRHQFGHGRVQNPRYDSTWTTGEHLLLSAWILPIAVKALLARGGHYVFSPVDEFRTRTFEDLLALEPFASVPSQYSDEEPISAWSAVMRDLEMRFAGEQIERLHREGRLAGGEDAGT
jgi:hypothetical protein